MSQKTPNPAINREHYDQTVALIKKIRVALEECQKCERCNLDVANEKSDSLAQLEVAENILKEYYPKGRPAK